MKLENELKQPRKPKRKKFLYEALFKSRSNDIPYKNSDIELAINMLSLKSNKRIRISLKSTPRVPPNITNNNCNPY